MKLLVAALFLMTSLAWGASNSPLGSATIFVYTVEKMSFKAAIVDTITLSGQLLGRTNAGTPRVNVSFDGKLTGPGYKIVVPDSEGNWFFQVDKTLLDGVQHSVRVWVPVATAGGAASTAYADNASAKAPFYYTLRVVSK